MTSKLENAHGQRPRTPAHADDPLAGVSLDVSEAQPRQRIDTGVDVLRETAHGNRSNWTTMRERPPVWVDRNHGGGLHWTNRSECLCCSHEGLAVPCHYREIDMKDQIRRVVRGEVNWGSLRGAETTIEHLDDQWTFRTDCSPIEVGAKDVATGLLNLQHRELELVEWASFLLAASDLVSLEALHGSARGESLLTACWDLAFEKHLRHGAVELAKAVLTEN